MRAASAQPGLIGLPDAAKRLGVCRERVNTLVREGSLPATRLGPWWYVREEDLESFAATYHPQRGGRRAGQATRSDLHRTAIAELLADWQNATAEELATAIELHPGNVRKHLAMLRAAGIVDRDDDGLWQLTTSGQRYQEARAKSA